MKILFAKRRRNGHTVFNKALLNDKDVVHKFEKTWSDAMSSCLHRSFTHLSMRANNYFEVRFSQEEGIAHTVTD